MAICAHENAFVCLPLYDCPRSRVSLVTDAETFRSGINVMEIKRAYVVLITADSACAAFIGNGKRFDLAPPFGDCLYKIFGAVAIRAFLDFCHIF